MKIWLLLFSVISISDIKAQIKEPVKWEYHIQQISQYEFEAILTAHIEKGWHLYSKDLPVGSGIPAQMKITSANTDVIEDFKEIGNKIEEFSQVFGVQVIYFSDSVKLIQKFRLKNVEKNIKVSSEITFQVCNDRICLAPSTLEFEQSVFNENEIKENNIANVKISRDSFAPPESNRIKVSSLNYLMPLIKCGPDQRIQKSGNGLVFILGMLGGLIALFTPCVFPMIPLTVSFFIRKSANKVTGRRNAFIYSSSIFIIFLAFSIPFHVVDGISGNIFNEISTSVWLNLFFFIVFIVFALSFFGYYNLSFPNWLLNKSAQAESAGGIIGIFFMALTLVIVSFSCTGPILGSLLGGVASGSKNIPMLLTFALGGFGLSWALIFGVLAMFPQILQSLPKSGGWMNTLKVSLGFIEIALALKFLSKADLVAKSFILKREMFIGLWILIAVGLASYLFGKIRFPYDSKNLNLSWHRKFSGSLILLFAAYLSTGLFPSIQPRLSVLSGILPPLNVSYYANINDGVLGLNPEHDYFLAIAKAKQENKPVLIDFTGYGCENCRKMEESVWSQPDVFSLIRNNVVLASLYVDDREELPKGEQTYIDYGNGQKKKITTIGDKWSLFQQVNFNNNSQPHYVLVTPKGEVINPPVSGYMSKDNFKQFLQCGLESFSNITGMASEKLPGYNFLK